MRASEVVTQKLGYVLSSIALFGLVFAPGTAQAGEMDAPPATSKDETVRVTASARGEVRSIEVTDVLKNATGADRLADQSNLNDVKAKDDDQAFDQDGPTYIWEASGRDVAYTGTTDAALPIALNVSYALNGAPIEPDALAGKAGHVRITFEFKNNSQLTSAIGGADEKIFTPFTAISALMFDNDAMKNIQVDNGRIIEDGSTVIVAGYAMPGLADSLGSFADDLDLPDSFTVEGDASSFEMKSGLTLVSAGLLADVDTDGLDSSELTEGTSALVDAADVLVEGSSALGSGIKALSAGSSTLAQGNSQLAQGLAQACENLPQLAESAGALDGTTSSLAEGAQGVYGATTQVKTALLQAQGAARRVANALDSLADGSLASLLDAAASEARANAGSADAIKEGISGAQEQSAKGVAGIEAAEGLITGTDPSSITAKQALADAKAALAQVDASLDQASKAAGGLSSAAADQAAGALAQADLKSLATNSSNLAAGLSTVVYQLGDESDATTLVGAAYALKSGAEALEGALSSFASGSKSFAGGVSAIVSAAVQLAEGARQLEEGSAALAEGSDALTDGLGAFKSQGVQALADKLDERFGGLIERIDALSAAARSYDTFSGKESATAGTVKFVIETAPIAKAQR